MRRLVNFLVLLGVGLGLITSISYAQTTVFSDSKLISVDFKEADLKDVIGILSVMTGLNIVVDDDVEGRVTVRFKNVPVLQALQSVLEINDCQYEVLDDIIKVTKIPILTRSFSLKFALASEEAELVKTLLSPEGSLKINESTNALVITDKKINLEEIEKTIQERDSPSLQLKTRVFPFKFIKADKAASFIQDQLSEVGKVEIVLPTNSLQVIDTSYNLAKLERHIASLDISQPREERTFTLKFALASDVKARLISDYLNFGDKIEADDEKNEIILTSNSYTLGRVEELLNGLDVPEKQISKKEFFVKDFKYLSLEKLAGLVRENLSSWGEIVEQDKAKNILIAKDTSYNLFELGKIIEEADTFVSLKKTKTYDEIEYASASSLAKKAEDSLSAEGKIVKIEEETFVVEDLEKNLEEIDDLVRSEDTLEAQLTEKKYLLRYLTPQEAKYHLQNIISEYGQIRLPEAGKEEVPGSVEDKKDYIVIPQEEIDSAEREESQGSKINPEETKEAEDNVIYITDLKKNIPNLDQAMEEIDSPSQVITRTFSMPEGSLEAIVVAIATMIGVNPEDIQGIEIGEETEWIKMKVTSPTIDLGDIGAVGKK